MQLLERCYENSAKTYNTASAKATANAHFIALVAVSLNQRLPAYGSRPASRPPSHCPVRPSSDDGRVSEPHGADSDESHRVPLMVLALCKLSDESPQVRASAASLLHAHGGAANADAPPTLIAEGLPWSAEHAQIELSARLAAACPRLAPAVVGEALRRAAVAPLELARTMMHFLPPWVERAALTLLTPSALNARVSHGGGGRLGSYSHMGRAASRPSWSAWSSSASQSPSWYQRLARIASSRACASAFLRSFSAAM